MKSQRYGKLLLCWFFLVAVLVALTGCGGSAEPPEEPEIEPPETVVEIESPEVVEIETPQEVRATVTVSSGSTLAIRKSPGTENKPEGDVLDRVPRGRILNVIDQHGDSRIKDGYTWWEVEDKETGHTGWTAAEFIEIEVLD